MEKEQYIRTAVRRARAMGITCEASLDDIRRFAGDLYEHGDLICRTVVREAEPTNLNSRLVRWPASRN
ncbi:MAG: hypothetical protein WBA12_11540 [Catalinimonas sp.]